jgi:hypothetical protein
MKLRQRLPCFVFDLLLSHIMALLRIRTSEFLLKVALKTHFGRPHKDPRGAVFLILSHPIGLSFLMI